ncbi:aldolase/citrate lyase family protein [Candidatus Latescibacterota bacterium]
MKQANAETLTIAQIESVKGLEAVRDIAAIDGIDALLVGPMDLSVSLGCPGDLANQRLQEAIGIIADAAEKSGKILGMHAGEALLEAWIPRGLRLVMNSLDTNMLKSGMTSVSSWYRNARAVHPES